MSRTRSWLWRFDWGSPLRDLVLAEAAALEVGAQVAPALFAGQTPFVPGLAAYAVAGGRVLGRGRPETLTLPDGCRQVHVRQ